MFKIIRKSGKINIIVALLFVIVLLGGTLILKITGVIKPSNSVAETTAYESEYKDKIENKVKNETMIETNNINKDKNVVIENNVENNILTFEELKSYEGTSQSYEKTYILLTKYYANCGSLITQKLNGDVEISLEVALDISKASSHLIEPEKSVKKAANEYLDKSQTYTINVSLKNNNTVKIIIKSEK